jgi:hypothetical protein
MFTGRSTTLLFRHDIIMHTFESELSVFTHDCLRYQESFVLGENHQEGETFI